MAPSTAVAPRQAARLLRGMKIGYVMDRFPRASHNFLLQEILALEARGIELHVFSLGTPDGCLDDTVVALARLRNPVQYFPDSPDSLADPATQAGLPGIGIASKQAQWIAGLVATLRIEHLHAHGVLDVTDVTRAAAGASGVGYSLTAHAEGLYEGADVPSLRAKIQDARFAVTFNNFDRGHLLRTCGFDLADKMHRIPIGINPKDLPFASADCQDSESVLAVGPLTESSGFADLIDAIGMLRDRGRAARLTIVGEGELDATLQAQISRLQLGRRIKLIGSVSRSELATLMRVHTAMALPWVAEDIDRDRLTSIVLEAMALGLPVLATDLPCIRELIDDGMSGRVITPHDPLWLAGVLETLFDSPVLRRHMAQKARNKVEWQFTASRNVPQLAQLFCEAVSIKMMAI